MTQAFSVPQSPGQSLSGWILEVLNRAAALPAPGIFPEPLQFRAPDGSLMVSVGSVTEAAEVFNQLMAVVQAEIMIGREIFGIPDELPARRPPSVAGEKE